MKRLEHRELVVAPHEGRLRGFRGGSVAFSHGSPRAARLIVCERDRLVGNGAARGASGDLIHQRSTRTGRALEL